MNKLAKAYVETSIDALDQQFKEMDKKLQKIYERYSRNEEELKKQMALLMYEYEVKEEKLNMTPKEQRKVKKQIDKTINQITLEELALEKDLVSEIEALGINLYEYKQHLLKALVDLSMIPLDLDKLDKIINTEIDGKLWSDRLWTNKQLIANKLKLHLDKLVRGETNINKIKKDLSDTINHKRYITERLWRNELARVQTAIENELATNEGLEYQLFLATLDSKTSDICRNLDGKEFKVTDKAKPNPPTGTHVNCRSCLITIPYKGWTSSTRRDNQSEKIIEFTTYKEWLKDR